MGQQPPAHRRSFRTVAIVGAVSIGLLPVAVFVALFVAAVVFDVPIELPPGDVYSLTIVNTTPRPVEAFICDDVTCTRGVAPETIQPGRHNRGSFNEDQYTPSPVGLADPVTHELLGCLTPPSTHSYSQPLATTEVATGSIHACEKHADAAHPAVTFHDPLAEDH